MKKCTTLGIIVSAMLKSASGEIVSLVAASDRASVTLGVTSFERVGGSGGNYSEGSDMDDGRQADIHGLKWYSR